MHVCLVIALIHTHHKHRRVIGGRSDDDFLGSASNVALGFFQGSEDASRLDNVLRVCLLPVNILWIFSKWTEIKSRKRLLVEDKYLLSIHNKMITIFRNRPLELAMRRIILYQINLRDRSG